MFQRGGCAGASTVSAFVGLVCVFICQLEPVCIQVGGVSGTSFNNNELFDVVGDGLSCMNL